MSEQSPLFREEAIQNYVATQMHGRLLRISPAWAAWAYWVLIAAVIGAVAFAAFAPVDTWEAGTGMVYEHTQDQTRIFALLPPNAKDRIQIGAPARARFLEGAALTVTEVRPELYGPDRLHQEFPVAREYLHLDQPALLVELEADTQADPGLNGTIDIRTGRTTILRILLSGRSQ